MWPVISLTLAVVSGVFLPSRGGHWLLIFPISYVWPSFRSYTFSFETFFIPFYPIPTPIFLSLLATYSTDLWIQYVLLFIQIFFDSFNQYTFQHIYPNIFWISY